MNIELYDRKARAILNRLDEPRRKSETPVKPLLVEIFGTSKSGKGSQIAQLDRWFRRNGFLVLTTQEGAEAERIRKVPRDHSYVFQMHHFAYVFDKFIKASISRDFHLVIFDRCLFDRLVWFEFSKRLGFITEEQNKLIKSFISQKQWMGMLDAVICLIADADISLEREYGKNSKVAIKYGLNMNPKSLVLMRESVDEVCAAAKKEIPNLPLYIADTTNASIEETRDDLISFIIDSAEKKMEI